MAGNSLPVPLLAVGSGFWVYPCVKFDGDVERLQIETRVRSDSREGLDFERFGDVREGNRRPKGTMGGIAFLGYCWKFGYFSYF